MHTRYRIATHYLCNREHFAAEIDQLTLALKATSVELRVSGRYAAFVRRSEWDSAILEKASYIVDTGLVNDCSAEEAYALALFVQAYLIAQRAEFAVWRIGGGLLWFQEGLIRAGWRLADQLNVFLASPGHSPVDPGIRSAISRDKEELADLAIPAIRHGRIQDDPKFSLAIKNHFVAELVKSLVDEKTAMVFEDSRGQLIGFIQGSLDIFASRVTGRHEGSIGLIAVRPEFFGKGIGSALYRAFMTRMFDEHVNEVEVCTQVGNVAAQNLYRKLGARESGRISTLHWHGPAGERELHNVEQ